MRSLRYLGVLAVSGFMIAAAINGGLAGAADQPILSSLSHQQTVASTVPADGDVNPYGTAIITKSVGKLQKGSVLVSNFNDSSNEQGTGTTLVQVRPDGHVSQFARLDNPSVTGRCPGGIGLTTALAVFS